MNFLLVLGATNKPWAIDEAVFRTGRFNCGIHIQGIKMTFVNLMP